MANTYSQIYLHFVLAVQNRMSVIQSDWKAELYKYICGIASKKGHKVFAINGMKDHVHVLISMSPNHSPSELMREIKRSSSIWINNNRLAKGKFSWQEGFGVFSYGKSQVSRIVNYIENQEEHHQRRNFIEEYLEFLDPFEIDYKKEYIYKSIES